MEKAMVFGIKASIAASLLAFGISFLVGITLFFTMHDVKVTREFMIGTQVFSCIISFVSMYVTLALMLKNTKAMSSTERQRSLQRTWQVFIAISLFFLIINPQKFLFQSWIAIATAIFSLLCSVAACFVMMKRKTVV